MRNISTAKQGLLLGFLLVLTAGMISSVSAQTDSSTVDVTVDAVSDVDINPTSLDYTNNGDRSIEPGNFNATSDIGFAGVEIENSGSQNLTDIQIRTTEPERRPFATGVADVYDAGNFIQVRPEPGIDGVKNPDAGGEGPITGNEDETGYHHPARVDFNASGSGLTYISTPTTAPTEGGVGTEWLYGRFRAGNEEFFWAIRANTGAGDDNNRCDGQNGGDKMRVGKAPHTDNQIGTVDFTDNGPGNYDEFNIVETANSNPYGRVNDTILRTSDGNKTYTVLTHCGGEQQSGVNDTYVISTRYDLDPIPASSRLPDTQSPLEPDTIDDASLQKLANNDNEPLEPGSHFTLFTAIQIPRGTAQGSIPQGDLTIKVAP